MVDFLSRGNEDPSARFTVVLAQPLAADAQSFLESVARQRYPSDRVRVVPEPSADMWALNADAADDSWIAFFDSPQPWSPDLLSSVDALLRAHSEVELVATTPVVGSARDSPGDRVWDLEESNLIIQPIGSFFRTAALREGPRPGDIGFRERFAGQDVLCRYLLARPRPLIGVLSSVAQGSATRPGAGGVPEAPYGSALDALPRRCHDLLAAARRGRDRAPAWVQAVVLYYLAEILAHEDRPVRAYRPTSDRLLRELHGSLALIAAELDPEVVATFDLRRFPVVWRDLLLHGYGEVPWHQEAAAVVARDKRQQLVRVEYRFSGPRPTEEYFVGGQAVTPPHSKDRALPYFGRTLLRQRLVWLPDGDLAMRLNGHVVPVRRKRAAKGKARARRRDRVLLWASATPPVQRQFRAAWVLMDRLNEADDSGEHLYHYIRSHHPETNSWFVLDRGSTDYGRLRRGDRRVVPHGSLRWKLLMLNCEHLISSHADMPIVRPPELGPLKNATRWRYAFLQHGVIKDDISGWLNSRDISVFVTSTPAEHASICGDDTAYMVTSREARLTGMPRFDRLLAEAERFPPDRRDLVLFAPTWRQWLVTAPPPGSSRRALTPSFGTSEFAVQWRSLIASDEVRRVAEQHNLRVATLLHPHLQAVKDELNLPPWVESFAFDGKPVRELFARSRVLVTDYSSMAFNAAYIDRPVVYFQFDRERMFGGGHVGRLGYFDYERDGFGPVATALPRAVESVVATVDSGFEPAPEYARRITECFPQRDGRCCERAYQAILESVQPYRGP